MVQCHGDVNMFGCAPPGRTPCPEGPAENSPVIYRRGWVQGNPARFINE